MLATNAMQKAVRWLKQHITPMTEVPEALATIDALEAALAEQPNLVNVLRACADQLEKVPGSTLFPHWDLKNEPSMSEEQRQHNEQVRYTASVILDADAFGGGNVPHGAVADLVHYIADMLEGVIVDEFAAEEPEEAEVSPTELARVHRRENLAYAQAGMRSRGGETEWWDEAIHDLARAEGISIFLLRGDLYSEALAICRLSDVPRVHEDVACPGCFERRTDNLVWQENGEGGVQCQICGCRYTPPKKA